jgi:hypothetical protein
VRWDELVGEARKKSRRGRKEREIESVMAMGSGE